MIRWQIWSFCLLLCMMVGGMVACEPPQMIKTATACYEIKNGGELKTGDTLCIYNCSVGDVAWMAVVKDSNEFKRQFTVYPAETGHYWHIVLRDTGRLFCRITAGFENAYAPLKVKTFEIKVTAQRVD
jgi:hypothetical protein